LNDESAGKCEIHLTYCNILAPWVTMCRTTCTVQKMLRSSHTLYSFWMHLRANSDYFPIQH